MKHKRERGTIIITVVLIMLVLTIVGIAVLFTMVTDREIARNDQLDKEAFYIAESGLRAGEAAVRSPAVPGDWTNTLVGLSGTPNPADLPPALFNQASYQSQPGWICRANLITGASLSQVPFTYTNPVTGQIRTGQYSLYIRNNLDDSLGAGLLQDVDKILELVSIGQLLDQNGNILATSGLSERFLIVSASKGSYDQKGGGSLGAGTVFSSTPDGSLTITMP